MSVSVYLCTGTKGFQYALPSAGSADYLTEHINGRPRSGPWRPPRVDIVTCSDAGRALEEFDVSHLGGATEIVLTDPAIDVIGETLRKYGELLPLKSAGRRLHVFNATVIADALDLGASEVARFPDGTMYGVWKYAFKDAVVNGLGIFRLAGLRVSPVLFTEPIVETWKCSGLRGLDFVKVPDLRDGVQAGLRSVPVSDGAGSMGRDDGGMKAAGNDPMTASGIARLQERFGVTLPESYVRFLLQFPPRLCQLYYDYGSWRSRLCDEDVLANADKLAELNAQFREWGKDEEAPADAANYWAIGTDIGGNYYLIKTASKAVVVYFCESETGSIFKLDPNVDAFVERIYQYWTDCRSPKGCLET